MQPTILKRIFLVLSFLTFSLQAFSYQIETLDDGLYRFIDDRHRSIFMITKQGALVTDPMNTAAATWLKGQIKERFNVPIKYVIYSHNHSDHIYGGEIFDDPQTVFVAHELAAQDIYNTKANTVAPDVTFKNEMLLRLGSKTVRLAYHGPNDGRGSISMFFEQQKLLYVVDWIVVGRMPWQKLWSYDIQGMINSTEDVLGYDFTTFVGGHANIGSRQDVARYLRYLQGLYSQVTAAVLDGKSLELIQKTVDLSEFSDLDNYEKWLPLNVEGVYERLMEESGIGWRPDIVRP
ncbi:MBL fold metallo-hydrolase [uncultured Paraglaciecola sp.]|uniref:MBL fold metallo-hydrolase n=1 Tax=uncultured Paraglaciecola sp. TaxID=1765024 RepID=UPI0030D93143|tara:strand:+ start:60401 stop:61273 length:873 start_codon:yes stop_codon:yes gene_type:complete